MAVRIEKSGAVWTVIHDRPEARNAMDPASADALTAAFSELRSAAGLSVGNSTVGLMAEHALR